MRSMTHYVLASGATIVRSYTTYAPMRVFTALSLVFLGAGVLGVGRFVFRYLQDPEYSGFIQSLVISAAALVLGVQTFFMGVLADVVAANRKLTEDLLYRQKRAYTEARIREGQAAIRPLEPRSSLRSGRG
jgi:hypothetical protein